MQLIDYFDRGADRFSQLYILLTHPDLRKYDYSLLRNLAYASAPMSVDQPVEAIEVKKTLREPYWAGHDREI